MDSAKLNDMQVTFHHSPSRHSHPCQDAAKRALAKFPNIGPFEDGPRTVQSLSRLRTVTAEYALGAWAGLFSFPSNRGHSFLPSRTIPMGDLSSPPTSKGAPG